MLFITLGVSLHARTWTSKDGRTIEAELVSQNTGAGEVTIKRRNGKIYTVKIGTLSQKDQE